MTHFNLLLKPYNGNIKLFVKYIVKINLLAINKKYIFIIVNYVT